jgi:hypothetical protein
MAQSEERRIHNPEVMGSKPIGGTTLCFDFMAFLHIFMAFPYKQVHTHKKTHNNAQAQALAHTAHTHTRTHTHTRHMHTLAHTAHTHTHHPVNLSPAT